MTSKRWLIGLGLLAVLGAGVGCGDGGAVSDESDGGATVVSYATEVQPIFTDHCGPCHIEDMQGGLSLNSYQGVTTSGQHAPIIEAGKPETSFLMIVVRSGSMPHDIPALSEGDVQTLNDWIMQGAQDN